MLQNCAFATTPQEFERSMKAIQDKDNTLHDWLKKISPKHLSRAYFNVRLRCDVLLNNLCLVFNRQLIFARDKPIITCIDNIRGYLMKRMVVVHKTIAKCQGPLAPVATTLFEKIKTEANPYTVIWNGNTKYQVTDPTNEKRDVDMEQRTCSCRTWELMGMSCRHAVACIYNMAMSGQSDGIAERWVDEASWLETWKKVYAKTLEPINSMELWPISPCSTTITAPKYHKKIGRPKKKRRKYAEEILELSQNLQKVQVGHNKRSCAKRAQGGSAMVGKQTRSAKAVGKVAAKPFETGKTAVKRTMAGKQVADANDAGKRKRAETKGGAAIYL
ncbi:uncharacterized protein LOC143584551 [Bidens hawaiensis]|uniref:uncharacterized protein LOC143584551 n=1 Tax=Bidens hawaiensis TaxID=980011 RepID=UPI00404A167D